MLGYAVLPLPVFPLPFSFRFLCRWTEEMIRKRKHTVYRGSPFLILPWRTDEVFVVRSILSVCGKHILGDEYTQSFTGLEASLEELLHKKLTKASSGKKFKCGCVEKKKKKLPLAIIEAV